MTTLARRVQVVIVTPGAAPHVVFDSSPGGGPPQSTNLAFPNSPDAYPNQLYPAAA
jgi:hypothetical protein